MKWLTGTLSIVLVCVCIIAAYAVFIFSGLPTEVISGGNTLTAYPTPSEEPAATVMADRQEISYDIIHAASGRIELFSNLPEATDSASAKQVYGCRRMTSAGFYTKSRTPLGLFQIGPRIISDEIQSALADGILYETADNRFRISPSVEQPVGSFALQSGPIVRIHGAPRPLALHTDEYARRIIAAVSESNELYFIVLYTKESVFGGPPLAMVPQIIESVASREHLRLTDAVNLDGGSASVFISETRTLSELQPAGGFFCIK